jgi:hypothetical protein
MASFIVNFKGLKMTQIDALTQALFLAITAPTDKKANQAVKLANELAKLHSPVVAKTSLEVAQDTSLCARAAVCTDGAS